MKRAIFQNLNQFEIIEDSKPKISPGEILLKVDLCGLCGSDLKKLQGGPLKPPQTLGHEVVGTIENMGEQINSKHSDFSIGDQVVVAHHVPCFECHYCQHENFSMCREFKKSNLDPGGFAQFLRIPKEHVAHTTFKIPENVALEKAMLTEPLACCLRCINRLSIRKNDQILLMGFGSVGFLLCSILKTIPTEIIVADLDPQRLDLADQLGYQSLNPLQTPLEHVIEEKTQGRGVDVVLFTAGSSDLLKKSLTWVRDGGTLCFFSELKGGKSELNTHEIYRREITLNASYSPGPKDLKNAFQMIVDQRIDLEGLPIHYFALDQMKDAIQQTLDRKIMKAAIKPW